ncbi:MAG: hydantoinase/oxoprolinase family protein [Chloroflexi bacterium]|nr:hydantoinase/oxoprolinase family protein [Chloroflexota bacterium]
MSNYSVGIDVGGTFTDVALVEMETGKTWFAKVPSTPKDPSLGLIKGLRKAARIAEIDVQTIGRVIHGTTVATNAILESKPTVVALVTTAGFKSVLEIGRHDIPVGDNYYSWIKPTRPVTPDLIFEISERVSAEGEILVPLDEQACRTVGRRLAALGVESVGVCFLYSFLRPEHEQRAAEILRAECPKAWVSISSEVLPQYREYERSMATVLNAYVTPHVSQYLGALESRLKESNLRGTSLFIMKSNGGVVGAPAAARQAIHTALSGPAAGVIGATTLSNEAGFRNVITIDVGGTSADISLVRDGKPAFTSEGKIGPFPLQLPILDIHTIGAGGGSIAAVNEAGRLTVGPRSAGAEPGPVCYGHGGTTPTVTDAHLVLGRIPPALLSGDIPLDCSAAERAIMDQIAKPLGLSLEEAALGVLSIVNANMVGAIRKVSVERGHDPRLFTLVAFGGAGPLHGMDLARLLGIPRVVVPRTPGVLSTHGLLNADLRNDFVQTHIWEGPDYPVAEIEASFKELEARVRCAPEMQSPEWDGAIVRRTADLRYRGQNFELRVDVPEGPVTPETIRRLLDTFHSTHEQLYTFRLREARIEFVNLRVTVMAPLTKAKPLPTSRQAGRVDNAFMHERKIYFGKESGWVPTPCYDRSLLGIGTKLVGPAVVEQMDSTAVLASGQHAQIDKFGNLIVEVEPE